jgi:hypothetical protein
MKSWLLGVEVLAVFVLTLGCRGGNAELGTVRVSGTVRFKGQPVADAIVNFLSPTPGLRGAVGKTDASGRFELTTLTPGDGAMPGSYGVVISKQEGLPTDSKPTGLPDTKPPQGKDLLPSKYKTTSTSGLTADVKARGTNRFDFDLQE